MKQTLNVLQDLTGENRTIDDKIVPFKTIEDPKRPYRTKKTV